VARAAKPHERNSAVLRRLALRLRDGSAPVPAPSRGPALPPAPQSALTAAEDLDRELIGIGRAGRWGVTITVAAGQACVLPVGAGVRHVTARRGPCRGDARFADQYPVRTAALFVDRYVRSTAAAVYLILWLVVRLFTSAALVTPAIGRQAWSVRSLAPFARRYVGVTTSGLRGNAQGLDADGRLQFGRGRYVRCLTLAAAVPWKAGRISWGRCSLLPPRLVPTPTLPTLPTKPPEPTQSPAQVASRYTERFVYYRGKGLSPTDAAYAASGDALDFGGVTDADVVGESPLLAEVWAKAGVVCIAPPSAPGAGGAVPTPTEEPSEMPGTWHLGPCTTASLADVAAGASRLYFYGLWDAGLTRAKAAAASAAELPGQYALVSAVAVRRADPPVLEITHASGPLCVALSIADPKAVDYAPRPVEGPSEAPNTWHVGACTTA
jgi:hypothetical protein